MNPKQNPSPSRAVELWKRFVGMFGGDSVLRKFGDQPPPEWVSIIEKLRDFEVERGLRRLVYSGKGHVPTLPEFVKLCRTIGVAEGIEEPSEPVVSALPNPDAWKGDEWDSAANIHLLGHIRRTLAKDPKSYGRPASYLAMRDPARMKDKRLDASPEFVRAVGLLVEFKKLWARDMREGKTDTQTGAIEPYSIEEQKAAWVDCMTRAEAAIAEKAAA